MRLAGRLPVTLKTRAGNKEQAQSREAFGRNTNSCGWTLVLTYMRFDDESFIVFFYRIEKIAKAENLSIPKMAPYRHYVPLQ